MKRFKSNRGITLIALVVTIVILLILASVSINTVFGQNGLISKAKEAAKKYKDSEKQDMESLKNLESWLDEELADTELPVEPSKPNLSEGNGTKPYFPSDEFEQVVGTNLDNGLVIRNKTNGNEYVWIEVPNNRTDGTGPNYSTVINDNPAEIETAIKNYLTTNGLREEGYDDNEATFNELKNKMLVSVYKNGGFYIGRYEAGIEMENQGSTPTNRKSQVAIDSSSPTPVSKVDAYPYNYVTRDEAKQLSERLSKENQYTNTLMFGMQWDLVLQYLKTKGGLTDLQIKTDSKDWGNYQDATFDITRGAYSVEKDNGQNYTKVVGTHNKPITSKYEGELLTTGATDRNSKQNIYDLAGNVWEWTLEKNTSSFCVYRGGFFSFTSSVYSASNRTYNDTSGSNYSIGFRFSLYK